MRMFSLLFLTLLVPGISAQSPPLPAPDPHSIPSATIDDFPGLEAIRTRRNWIAPGEPGPFSLTDHVDLVGEAKACSETLARAQWKQDILSQFDAAVHFDNCAFEEGLQYIEDHIALIDTLDLAQPKNIPEAVDLAGRIIHSVQDFYAHTNYIELMASSGRPFDENLVIRVWTDQGREEVRNLVKKQLVSGRVWWNSPKKCMANVPTHGELAKDSTAHPTGRLRLNLWNRTAYRAALELADHATRQFLRFSYSRWPALKSRCGPVVVYLPPEDRRPDPAEPVARIMPKPLPSCRLDFRMVPIVSKTLQHVLDSAKRLGYAVPSRVLINPDTPEPDALSLQVVGDLPVSMVGNDGCPLERGSELFPIVLDDYSIRGLCVAVSSNPALIRCSGGEILEIASREQSSGQPNAALAYIFAHELSHIRHSDRSHFNAASRVIDLSKSVDEKWSILYEMCQGSDASREADRKQEERADEEALIILRDLVRRPPYRNLHALEGAAITENALSFDRASNAAHNWLLRIARDAPLPRRVLNADVPASEATARDIAKKLLCDIQKSTVGWITLPITNGTHPSEIDRLDRAQSALAALAEGVPTVKDTIPKESEMMLASALKLIAEQVSQTAELYAAIGRFLCENVDEDLSVICRDVTIIPPAAALEAEPR